MSYLNLPYKDNFQELCAAMPLFYLDVFEMREILKAQGKLLDGVCDSFELVIDDNFIRTADEPTIRAWEAALKIKGTANLTLEQRRSIVIARICGRGHIGEPEIREIISQYTDLAVTVAFAKGIITITIAGEIFGEDSLLETLLARIPAHLALKIILHVRRAFRQDVFIGQAAFERVNLYFEPETLDKLSSTRLVLAAQVASDHVRLYGNPPDVEKSATELLEVHNGALESPMLAGELAGVKTASTKMTPGASGAFYSTHVKSKLID